MSEHDDTKTTAQLLKQELQRQLSRYYLKRDLTKRERVLYWLVLATLCEKKVTRFDALEIGDTCFNSTVADIESRDCIRISRRPTKRLNGMNKQVDCHEYWLSDTAIEHAAAHISKVIAAKTMPFSKGLA